MDDSSADNTVGTAGIKLVHLLRHDSGWLINERTEGEIFSILRQIHAEGYAQAVTDVANKLRYHLPKFTITHGSRTCTVKDVLNELQLARLSHNGPQTKPHIDAINGVEGHRLEGEDKPLGSPPSGDDGKSPILLPVQLQPSAESGFGADLNSQRDEKGESQVES